jgi:hypothetical protein
LIILLLAAVILTKVMTQSLKRWRALPWVLTFVRMTEKQSKRRAPPATT